MRQVMTKEQRHAHILNTAKKLFQKYGYDHVTIADVITASNIARGTFYLHFDSLETLLTALFDQVVDELWKRISPLLEDMSIPFERCTIEVIHAVFRMFDSDKAMASVFYSGGGQAFVTKKQQAMYGKLGGFLVQSLEHRHGKTVENIEWTAIMLISLVGDMSYYASSHIPDEEKDAFEERLVEFVLAGLRRHLAAVITTGGNSI